jgi:carbohydrate ABC transporter membrane protein 1, CUT1 family (TC 3.A.1.1.-)
MDLGLTQKQTDELVDASYTGWIWTGENFRKMFLLPETRQILLNTGFYVASTLLLFNIGFALVLAVTTFYLPKGQAALFRALWFLPRITPSVLYVLLWKWLTWDTGFINAVVTNFGVTPRNWMLDTAANAWVTVIMINGFIGASMGMILFSSAITSIPKQMLYASEVDGANRWQQIRHIILPQLKWPILFITVYQTLSLLTSFEQIFLSTDGGPGFFN